MRARHVVAFAAFLALMIGSHAVSASLSPVGLWQATDPETKQPTGWFLVTEHQGVYTGTLAKMFLRPGQDPHIRCEQCTDDRHNHPWLGLQIIRGMRPDADNQYTGGTILDPRDGQVYSAMMTVSPDGQTLIVRGFLGFAFLGRNEYWTRLPDSAYREVDPAILANAGMHPPPSAKHPHG